MASREEEKERRRQERLAQETAEARAAARAKRIRAVIFGIVGVAAIGLIAVFAFGLAGGGDAGGGEREGEPRRPAAANVKLPDPQTTNIEEAAEKAGCELVRAKFEGEGHEERKFTAADYKTNPPTSGAHFPEWYEDGIYEPGGVDNPGMLVHTLEHGRVNIQYKKGTDSATVDQLEAFLAEKTGYHLLLYENPTDMKYEVAATAWTQLLGCPTMKPEVIDALRTFYQEYVDKGPEQVP